MRQLDEGIQTLLSSPNAVNLKRFSVGYSGLSELAVTQPLVNLEELDVRSTSLVNFTAGSNLANLTRLNLGCNRIYDYTQFIQQNAFSILRDLDLSYSVIGDGGIEILASYPLFSNLTRLNLSYTNLTADGVQMITNKFKSIVKIHWVWLDN